MPKRRRSTASPSVFREPSKQEMLKIEAESMARRTIMDSPSIKKMIQSKTREIMSAANGRGKKKR